MRRKALANVDFLIGLAIFMILLTILFVYLNKGSDEGNFLVDLLPDNWTTQNIEGASTLGLNLETGSLVSYDGAKWRKIKPTLQSVAAKEAFRAFYVDTQRKPQNSFSLSINDWRSWEVNPSKASLNYHEYGGIQIGSFSKQGFSGRDIQSVAPLLASNEFRFKPQDSSNGFIGTAIDAVTTIGGFFNGRGEEVSGFDEGVYLYISNFEARQKTKALDTVANWRDQILEGQPCELFITLKLNGIDKDYTVRKVYPYIFVNLDSPISDGLQSEYKKNLGCYDGKIPEYIEEDKFGWKNPSHMEIYSDSVAPIGWDGQKWVAFTDGKWQALSDKSITSFRIWFSSSNNKVYERFIMSDSQDKSFYEGLRFLFLTEGYGFRSNDLGRIYPKISLVKVIGSENPLIIRRITDIGAISNLAEGRKAVYKILDAYNLYLKSPEETKLIGTGNGPYLFELYEKDGNNYGALFYTYPNGRKVFTGLGISGSHIVYASAFENYYDIAKIKSLNIWLPRPGVTQIESNVIIGQISSAGVVRITYSPIRDDVVGATDESYDIMSRAVLNLFQEPKKLNALIKGQIPSSFFGGAST